MTNKEIWEFQDAQRIAGRGEFGVNNQPKVPMAIVTKCERIQPTCVGTAANGEPIWEGREMPRWQMEMFRLRYYGDFMAFWMKKRFYDITGFEMTHDEGSMQIHDWTHDLKRKYKKSERKNTGD